MLPEGNIGVNKFAQSINKVIDTDKRKRITGQVINKQLKKMGILSEIQTEEGRSRTIINSTFSQYGIEEVMRSFNGREYQQIVFNKGGKKYLLENLLRILEYGD